MLNVETKSEDLRSSRTLPLTPMQFNGPKAKVQLRLSVQRLRTLQQKKEAQAKAARRDIASLLERGKVETARIKTESVINEDIHVELLELLELYCELLLARFGLLEQTAREPDPGIAEAVASVIHGAPRTELKELHVLRDILMHKYGREFSVAVMEDRKLVSDRVLRKLVNDMPSEALVDAYLYEIAKGYGVDWTPQSPEYAEKEDENKASAVDGEPKEEESTVASSDKSKSDVGSKVLPEKAGKDETAKIEVKKSPPTEEDEFDALAKRFAALKKK
ncbi:hypothetical protein HMN09_00898200 [Mycena chlorophos]|uniref:DUF292-domain-containing protein n=1 Tax=Mycena chlorophos TaxID=658473 RepID=A0A8H6SQN0_MYCCL|nr:hypothetical protein HMN09_00898200 [Mycena chlorophos]